MRDAQLSHLLVAVRGSPMPPFNTYYTNLPLLSQVRLEVMIQDFFSLGVEILYVFAVVF
jgi:hypothetical protein